MALNDITVIPRVCYSDGQMLFVNDFQDEQNYHVRHRELQTAFLFTPGILAGLDVSASGSRVTVFGGAALDSMGRQIVLAGTATLNGVPVQQQGAAVWFDLKDSPYFAVGKTLTLILTVEVQPQPSDSGKRWPEPPRLSIERSAQGNQIVLAALSITATQPPKQPDGSQPPVKVEVSAAPGDRKQVVLSPARAPEIQADRIKGTLPASAVPDLDAAKIASGVLKPERVPAADLSKATGALDAARLSGALKPEQIPGLDAAKIASGVLSVERVPPSDLAKATGILDAAKVAGTLKAEQIPNLDASKIHSGVLSADRVPPADLAKATGALDAAKLTGALNPAQIPGLDASKIISGVLRPEHVPPVDFSRFTGTLKPEAIPDLDASKITSGRLSLDRLPDISGLTGSGIETVWAVDVSIGARGAGLFAAPAAGSKSGYLIGLLRIKTALGAVSYALGIAFYKRLMFFRSAGLEASGLKVDVFADSRKYEMEPAVSVVDIRFTGVAAADSFDIRDTGNGRIRSLVVVTPPSTPGGAAGAEAAANALRDAISPLSFMALLAEAPLPARLEIAAQALRDAGAIAPDAAPILVGQNPRWYLRAMDWGELIDVLRKFFQPSMAKAAQAAWSVAAAGASRDLVLPILVQKYSIGPDDLLSTTAGAFPLPSTQTVIIQQQDAGASAADAATSLAKSSPLFLNQPAQLGIALRIHFPATSGTPGEMVRALRNAGYSADAVRPALDLLFPGVTAADLNKAIQDGYGK